jgi:hypothetical protein
MPGSTLTLVDPCNQQQVRNPDWHYMRWNRQKAIDLLEARYPQYLPTFLDIETTVIAADFFRLFPLHAYGGVYLVRRTSAPTLLGRIERHNMFLVRRYGHSSRGFLFCMELSPVANVSNCFSVDIVHVFHFKAFSGWRLCLQ